MGKSIIIALIFIRIGFTQSTGDIAFVGWNSDGDDDINFITFIDIAEGTTIYFSDDEYNNGWASSEGVFSWIAPNGGINSGSIIQIYDCSASISTSEGTTSVEDAGFDVSNSEEAVYAYLSDNTWNIGNFTFLAAFCNATNFGSFLAGTGLTEDTDAWSWGNKDNWKYTGSTNSNSVSEMKTNLQNIGNWVSSDGTGDQSFTFSLTDYSLPVELGYFNVQNSNGVVAINWITESEINNLGFLIYRKTMNDPFILLDSYKANNKLRGQGSVTYRSEYQYIDNKVFVGQTYTYQLADVDYFGKETKHDPVSIIVKSRSIVMKPSFPNPFNPVTSFTIVAGEKGVVKVEVFNIIGQRICVLKNEVLPIGEFILTWDGTDDSGIQSPSGIYFIGMQSGKYNQVQKIVLTR